MIVHRNTAQQRNCALRNLLAGALKFLSVSTLLESTQAEAR
jgi:hypothetical protein